MGLSNGKQTCMICLGIGVVAFVAYKVYKIIKLATAFVYNDISTDGMVYII